MDIDLDPQANANQLPFVNARRTLLVGLGTSGARVCGQIMERLTWAYDSPQNTPWIRALILETAGVSEDLKHYPNTRLVPLAIEKQEYMGLVRNPAMYDAQMGFSAWDIPELTGQADAFTDAITNGANNKRILGRLALLFPKNYQAVTAAITNSLEQLGRLDTKEANKAFARTNEKVQIDLEGEIYVYVIGTLCGGTSSGGFIDLGYILRTLPGYQNIVTTGVFLLPSAAHGNPKHIANVYAALTELNHFSSDNTRYRQQVADRLITAERGLRPYQYTYLVQARGGASEEYAKLVTGIADYIYSDVIGGTAQDRDNTRTNIADYFGAKDKMGATQKYFTFGLGTIEFPYIKVAKACSLRLSMRGLTELVGKGELNETEATSMVNQIPLMRLPDMVSRLLQRKDAPSNLRNDIEEVLNANRNTTALKDLSVTVAQIEAAFVDRGQGGQHQNLPHNIVDNTVAANRLPVRNELVQLLNDQITDYLMGDRARGILDLKTFLAAVEQRLESNIAATLRQLPDANAQVAADRAQKQAEMCQHDIPLIVTAHRKPSVKRYVDTCIKRRTEYYYSRLNAFCSTHAKDIYQHCLDYVRRVLGRLSNSAGLEREAIAIREAMLKLYTTIDKSDGAPNDGSVRVINGVELFTPGQTVQTEYRACILHHNRDLQGQFDDYERISGKRAVEQEYLRDARALLLSDINTDTRFDMEGRTELPNYDEYQLLTYARPARPVFSLLNSRSIISRLLAQGDQLGQRIQIASEASRLFLNINTGHPRHEEATNKSYQFVFYSTEDDQGGQFKRSIENAHILRSQDRTAFINDHQQIMILNERGAFSLGMVQELLTEADSHWRDVNLTSPAHSHTRADVEDWISWDESYEKMLIATRNIFLVGIALDIIKQVNAVQYQFMRPPLKLGEKNAVPVTISNDLDIACRTIKTNNIKANLEEKIREYREHNFVDDMFERIKEFVANSDNKFVLGPRSLNSDEIRNYLMDYLRQDKELWDRYTQAYPNTAELRYLREKDGRTAYYCPCDKEHFLGNSASDLYVTISTPKGSITSLKCSYCKKSLE